LARHFAAGDGDTEPPRGTAKTAIEFQPIILADIGRGEKGDERLAWGSAHGGDVAERAAEGFPSDAGGIVGAKEMDILGDAIGFEQEELVFPGSAESGAIVAGAERLIGWDRDKAEKAFEQSILGAGLHFRMSGQ
jgi:hypothetical protein